jgi:hypothetical protein
MIVVNVHRCGMVRKEDLSCVLDELMFLFKGFCLHPLVSSSSHSSIWWLKSPMEGIRDKFTKLDHSHQTLVMVLLILMIILSCICSIGMVIRLFINRRDNSTPHNGVEYIMLGNLDEDEHLSNEATTIPISQIEQT